MLMLSKLDVIELARQGWTCWLDLYSAVLDSRAGDSLEARSNGSGSLTGDVLF